MLRRGSLVEKMDSTGIALIRTGEAATSLIIQISILVAQNCNLQMIRFTLEPASRSEEMLLL